MGYVLLGIWLIILPVCVGNIWNFGDRKCLSMNWLWGQFALWSVFQVIAVYYILKYGTLSRVTEVYIWISCVLAGFGLIMGLYRLYKNNSNKNVDNRPVNAGQMWTKELRILAIVFVLLWLVQMLAIFWLAVNDGDDAYYMSIASIAESSDSMYNVNAYSFGGTELTYRYALAPFPIWIAFLSRISGIHTLILGHVLLGIFLITMSYVIYGQAGRILFDKDRKKILLFLIFIAVLYIWGNTSSHTPESFLLLRSRQGKALVAGIVFPAMISLILQIGRLLQEKQKISGRYFILATTVILTGCLGSTLGGSLVILLWGSALLFLTIGFRRWKLIPCGILSVLPGAMFALLYLWK